MKQVEAGTDDRERTTWVSSRQHAREQFVEGVSRYLLARQAALSHLVQTELQDVNEREERHHVADVDDVGGDAWDEDTALTLLEQEGSELEQIAEALDRIDRGTYGDCADCGAPIPSERLEALPLATTCVACQRTRETPAP